MPLFATLRCGCCSAAVHAGVPAAAAAAAPHALQRAALRARHARQDCLRALCAIVTQQQTFRRRVRRRHTRTAVVL
jgi:hypothetical protein